MGYTAGTDMQVAGFDRNPAAVDIHFAFTLMHEDNFIDRDVDLPRPPINLPLEIRLARF
jgi:hypothetical protein